MKLDDMFIEERKRAEEEGWTKVDVVYDDVYGGCYAGGIDPEDGKWKKLPFSELTTKEITK